MRGARSILAGSFVVLLFLDIAATANEVQIPPVVVDAYEAIRISPAQKPRVDPHIASTLENASAAVKREALREKYPSQRRIRQRVAAAFSASRDAIVAELEPAQVAAYDAFAAEIIAVMSSHSGRDGAEILDSIVHDH